MTEQENPGIYVQIDEWLPLYKGKIYVVDEINGRMYLSKGEHLMQIAETASHRPFQDYELSMSRHIPEREYFGQGDQEPPLGSEPEIAGEGKGDVGPLTSAVGAIGEIGRTPIPVAESTRHPGEKSLPPVREHERAGPDQTVNPQLLHKDREGLLEKLEVTIYEGNLNGHCPAPQTHVDLQEEGQGKKR